MLPCDRTVGTWGPGDMVEPSHLPTLDHLPIPVVLGEREMTFYLI